MGDLKHSVLVGVLAILAIFSLSIAYAATEDFQYSAASQYQACACDAFAIPAIIENTGEVVSFYQISHQGSAAEWVQTVPSVISVNAGESASVANFVNVPCDARGTYEIYTQVESTFGLNKVHVANINVNKCQVIDVSLATPSTAMVCAGDVASYEFNLENSGSFREDLKVEIDNIEDISQFNLPSYTVNPGRTEKAYLYITSFKDIGNYQANITFTATRSGWEYKIPIRYSSVDCSPKDVSGDEVGLPSIATLLNVAVILLIILLLIVFIVLVVKVVDKRRRTEAVMTDKEKGKLNSEKEKEKLRKRKEREERRRKFRERWESARLKRKEEREKARKRREEERKKAQEKRDKERQEKEKQKKADARKVANKKTRDEKKKNDQKQTKPARKKTAGKKNSIKSTILWIIIIIVALLLLGLIIWGIIAAVPYISDMFQSNATMDGNATNISNETIDIFDNSTGDAFDNETLNATNITDVESNNPVIGFFTNYGTACSVWISIFFILFIASLFLLGIKDGVDWSKAKKQWFKYVKYTLPIVLFIALLLSFVFCIMSNLSSEWPGSCSIVTIENETYDGGYFASNESIFNTTELMNDSSVIVDKKPVSSCFCTTLFGFDGWWCLILLALLIVIILIIMWLVVVVPVWVAGLKRKQKKGAKATEKQKKSSVRKTARKSKKEKKDPKILNIWKDIILLLILLLLLLAIGVYFYNAYKMEQPFMKLLDTEEFDHPYDESLICNATFEHNGIALTLPETQLFDINNATYLLEYSWYLEDLDEEGNYSLEVENQRSNRLLTRDIEIGDRWICEVSFILEETDDATNETNVTVQRFNSTIYNIIDPEAIIEDEQPEEIEQEITNETNVSDDADIVEDTEVIDVNESGIEENETVMEEPDEVDQMITFIAENNLTKSFHYLVMSSGSKVIDLTDNFEDPDGDELFFTSATNSSNITIDIWKGKATITAAEGFRGLADAKFLAEDPSGEIVTATMTIVVTNEPVWEESYTYILIGMVIVLLLIILIVFLNTKPVKKSEQENNKPKDEKPVNDKQGIEEEPSKPDSKKSEGFFKNF
ncbi:hypothetical protein H6503_02045 [Candidatus Woesearchaeota archaeon]|nr:hypothetical protein [Candidatus Woesearchaeota archaeon]